MKIKTLVTSFIAGASLFAVVGTASAACTYRVTGDLNIYGASAQFVFWKNEFVNYLTKAGCTWNNGASWADSTVTDSATNPSHYAVQANCSAVAGAPAVVNFRVSSKASYDGPPAVDAQQTPYTDNQCGTGAALNQRPLLHGGTSGCAWGATNCAAPTFAHGDCEVVNWGASDVAVGDFQQVTVGGSNPRNFKLNPLAMVNGTVDFCNPNAVGFAFFVNNSVTKTDSTILNSIGELEARLIYTGNITNWNQLASVSMNSQAVVACARNSGSGTHATIDFQVVRPGALFTTNIGNHIFIEKTGDMMSCIDTHAGAIGYADADRPPLSNTTGPLMISGVAPSAASLIAGTYWFTDGAQHSYVTPANSTDNMFVDLCSYAGRPDKVPSPTWASTCQMNFLPKTFGTLGNWAPSTVKGTNGCTCVGL